MSIQTFEPFTTLADYKQCPKGWGNLDLILGIMSPPIFHTDHL